MTDDLKILENLYERMLKIRITEETITEKYSEWEMRCPTHLSIGQEAIASGVCGNLTNKDFVVSTHRSHAHYIAKGGDMNGMIAEIYGKSTGCSAGKGGSMHLIDKSVGFMGSTAIVGNTIPLAVGLALSIQMKGTNNISCVFFGDGASNQGSFHESMNLCAIWKLPVVFFCENNQYAVSFHVERSTSVSDISVRAQGYNASGITVDGMDVVSVYEATLQAVERARRGEGPTLIEAKTYRFFGHSRGDPQFGPYRTKEEVDEWRKRDPLLLTEKLLSLTKAQKKTHLDAVKKEMKEALNFAESSPEATLESALEDVFA